MLLVVNAKPGANTFSAASTQPFDSTVHYLDALISQNLRHPAQSTATSQCPQDGLDGLDDLYFIDLLRSMKHHFADKFDDVPHKLFCDDLRFGNILVNDSYDIVAIIDLEFTYAAPASFLCSPPWWLTGTEPFEWNKEDEQDFEVKLKMFLIELEEEETARGEAGHTLSNLMRRCMDDGTFWYNMAVRESMKLAEIMRHCIHTEPFQSFKNTQSSVE